MIDTNTHETGTAAARRPWLRPVVTIAAAATAALAVWALATLAGIDLVAGPITIGPASIVAAVLVAGGAAWLLRWLLARLRAGKAIWTTIAAIVLVLSLASPVVSGAAGAALAVLELMHVLVGGGLLLGIRGVHDTALVRSVEADDDDAA